MSTKTQKNVKIKLNNGTNYDPLVMRAAIKIKNAIANSKEDINARHMRKIHDQLAYHDRFLSRAKSYFQHINRVPTETITDLLKVSDNYLHDVISHASNLQNTNDNNDILSAKDIYNDLISIKMTYKDFLFKDLILSAVTEDIYLEWYDEEFFFGKFRITIDFSRVMLWKECIRVIALNPNPANSDIGITHPHIKNNTPCYGNIEEIIRKSIRNGNVETIFNLINELLNSYNDDSPYEELSNWNGSRYSCELCGRRISESSIQYCGECSHDICPDCMTSCETCEDFLCDNCLQICHNCGKCTCRDCINKCIECGDLFCDSCSEEDLCPDCNTTACIECGTRQDMDDMYECEECSEKHCIDCKRKCDNCNKVYCLSCIDNDECSLIGDQNEA